MYKLDGSTPNDIEKREFSERIVENLTSLNILAEDFSVTESQRDNPQLLDENFSPIPGYIITENNVIMRRHSSSHDQRMSRKSDDGQSSRKILSAPPSLAILDEPTNTSTDRLWRGGYHSFIQFLHNHPLDAFIFDRCHHS